MYINVLSLLIHEMCSFIIVVECSPGTFSGTGYQPCSPCPAGTYQPNNGGFECLECGNGSPETFCTMSSEEVK